MSRRRSAANHWYQSWQTPGECSGPHAVATSLNEKVDADDAKPIELDRIVQNVVGGQNADSAENKMPTLQRTTSNAHTDGSKKPTMHRTKSLKTMDKDKYSPKARRTIASQLDRGTAHPHTHPHTFAPRHFKHGIEVVQKRRLDTHGRTLLLEGSCPYLQNTVAPDDIVDHMTLESVAFARSSGSSGSPERSSSTFITTALGEPMNQEQARALVEMRARELQAKDLKQAVVDDQKQELVEQLMKMKLALLPDSSPQIETALNCACGEENMTCAEDITDTKELSLGDEMPRGEECRINKPGPQAPVLRPNSFLPRTGSFHRDLYGMERQHDAKSDFVVSLDSPQRVQKANFHQDSAEWHRVLHRKESSRSETGKIQDQRDWQDPRPEKYLANRDCASGDQDSTRLGWQEKTRDTEDYDTGDSADLRTNYMQDRVLMDANKSDHNFEDT